MFTVRSKTNGSPKVRRSRVLLTATALVVATVFSIVATPTPASVYPGRDGWYPYYSYEGLYPEQTGCGFSNIFTCDGYWNGARVTLRYYYSGTCGSYAKITNAPGDCVVWLAREAGSYGGPAGLVWETVDPGINFAYTQVANNLQGRVTQAYVTCSDYEIARTPHY